MAAVVATLALGAGPGSAGAGEPATAEKNPAFPITYGKGTYLGFWLGFDAASGDAPISFDHAVTIDINRDGLDDMVFHSTSMHNLQQNALPERVFVSNGRKLRDETRKYFPSSARAIVTRDLHVADFNNDGAPDIFFNNGGTEAVDPFPGERNRILLSQPGTLYRDATATSLPNIIDDSHGSTTGDFDKDGNVDIFVNTIGCDCFTDDYYLRNNGQGEFSLAGTWAAPGAYLPADAPTAPGTSAYWTQALDIDADGDIDVYTASTIPTAENIYYLENDGAGHFSFSSHLIPGFPDTDTLPLPEDSEVADIDRDGDDDLLLSRMSSTNSVIQILVNRHDGIVTDESYRISDQAPGAGGIPNTTGGSRLTVVDLDGDGDPDIYVHRWTPDFSGTIACAYLNDGTGNFSRAPTSRLPKVTPTYFPIDVNGDGLVDFLSDQTWQDDWLSNHKKQFKLLLARLDVPVRRSGWETDDRIAGGSKADVLDGKGGADVLRGNGGPDRIRGGSGNDTLIGGPGRDQLAGNSGEDIFDFNASDVLQTCPKCDVVGDFRSGEDKIDLSGIDAQVRRKGDQPFKFIGKRRFSGKAGQLRYARVRGGVVVQADTNGDRRADFEIIVKRARGLKGRDFVL